MHNKLSALPQYYDASIHDALIDRGFAQRSVAKRYGDVVSITKQGMNLLMSSAQVVKETPKRAAPNTRRETRQQRAVEPVTPSSAPAQASYRAPLAARAKVVAKRGRLS